jgi:hypothetical protein
MYTQWYERFAQNKVELARFEITQSEVKPNRKHLPDPKRHHGRPCLVRPGQPGCIRSLNDVRDVPIQGTAEAIFHVQLQQSFDASKTEICNRIKKGVQIFEKERPTCLATEWNKDGIGY